MFISKAFIRLRLGSGNEVYILRQHERFENNVGNRLYTL